MGERETVAILPRFLRGCADEGITVQPFMLRKVADEMDRLMIVVDRLKACLVASGVSEGLVEGIAADPPSAAEAIRYEYHQAAAEYGSGSQR